MPSSANKTKTGEWKEERGQRAPEDSCDGYGKHIGQSSELRFLFSCDDAQRPTLGPQVGGMS